jgi:N-acetylglucosaminyl-diphospho-decaprenol L-rhamnosyltransferase
MIHTDAPDVSIVIVNWNSREFLAKCLASVYSTSPAAAVEVLVIDNASYDGSDALVQAQFPSVKFIQGRENLGFARANNVAAAQATGRNILFLNPDTEVIGSAIESMVRFVDGRADAGAVGCRLLNTDGSLQTSCVQAYPTILNQALDNELLHRMFPMSALWGMRALFDGAETPAVVEGLSGACIVMKTQAFLEVGGFTEDYFMYAEDMDLCFKLQASGRSNFYLRDVVVVHHGGQSSGASSESQFGNVLMRESIARFLHLRRGVLHAYVYRMAMALTALVRISLLSAAIVFSLGRGRSAAIDGGLRKWRSVLRWTVGAESWVRNPGAR